MTTSHKLALLGDDRGHHSHDELNALIPRLARECSLAAEWVPTDSAFDVTRYDGIWLVPGSPYADEAAVIQALSVIRTEGIPFLGTCGGMQYAVVEFLRVVCGRAATHEESNGAQDDNAVAALACSLYGEERLVTPVAGSRFGNWVAEPFLGVHYCNYAATADAIAQLTRAGVVVGATAPDAGAEVLEFPNHPFYITSMFQPHIGASRNEPLHPLIEAFATAVRDG